MNDLKFCMQCDTGKADVDRRCRWCKFLSCIDCMPEDFVMCIHCLTTRVDIPSDPKLGRK